MAFSKIACHASFLMWNILRRMKPQNFEPFTTTTFIAKTSQLCSAPQERDSQYHQYDRHHKHDQTDRAEARANKAQAKCDGTLPYLRANCTFTAFPSAPHFPSPRFPYVYQRQCFFCSAVVTVYTQGTVLVPEKYIGTGKPFGWQWHCGYGYTLQARTPAKYEGQCTGVAPFFYEFHSICDLWLIYNSKHFPLMDGHRRLIG